MNQFAIKMALKEEEDEKRKGIKDTDASGAAVTKYN